jgi:NAD-dependent deacetylase
LFKRPRLMDPAARMCAVALQAGAQLVIVNADRTPYDNSAAAILRGRIGETLPSIVGSMPDAVTA